MNPFIGNSTKGGIIEMLSSEWPLTAKKIYLRLTKKSSISVTYQAVHKALKELTETEILEKRKEGYLINKDWIKKLGDFSEKTKEDLESSGKEKEVRTIQKISFNNHREFIKFHMAFVEETIKKEGKVNMVFHYRHVPYPHVLSNEEIKKVKESMTKIKWTILSKKDTSIGRWCAKQWRKMGVKVKVGADIAADRIIILNDYVINIYMSKEAIKKWDKAYSAKNINSFNISSTIESISNSKYKTIITIMKDKEIASLLNC